MNEKNYNLSSSKTYELKTTTKTTQNVTNNKENKPNSNTEIMDFDSNVNEKAAVTIKEEELAKLEKEKEKLETQKKEIKSRITDEKWDVWELFFNNDKYNKDIDALEKKLKQIEKELKEVNNKITNLTTTGIERALQCELITSYDNEITKLEKEIKALETKIQEKQGELNRKRTAQSRARGLSSISDDDLDKIEKEIINLKEKVKQKKQEKTELKKVRKTTTNYITEIYYSNLKYNNDFENNIQINLTEEEAHQISQIYGTLYNTSFSYLVTTDKFYDFDEINKFYEENKDLFFEIDWEIVKKAYEKGFNIYEVAIKNPKLTEASINNEFFPTATFDGEYPLGTFAHIINYMTKEEKNNVLYLYNTEGTEAANKYLTFKQQEINSRIGFVQASEFLEKVNNSSDVGAFLKTALKGTGDGIENFFEGLDNALGGMDGVMSASQFETMYIISWMSESDIDKLEGFTKEEKEKLKEIKGLNDSKFLQGTYEISSSIGNMIPSIAASTVVSIAATPVAGKVVGTALMGLSSGGNAAESMYQQGYGFYESIHYGMLSGSSEALLGYFLGGIPGLSKLDDLPGLKGYITNMLMEGGEESLQAIIDPYLQSVALGTEPEINWEEVKKSGIYGMITAGLLNGGEIVTSIGNISVNSLPKENISIIAKAEKMGIKIDYNKILEANYIQQLNVTINYNEYNNLCNKLGVTEKIDINTFYSNPESIVNEQMIDKLNLLSTNNPDEITKIFKEISSIDPKISNELLLNTDAIYMEVLTKQLLKPALNYYNEAINFANTDNATAFKTYRTHCETHVKEVAELTLESAVAVSEVYKKDGYAEVNLYEVYIAALWHDVGMAAGSENIKAINSNYNKKTGEYNPTILKESKNGNDTRSNHTLNSALAILDNSKYFNETLGVDPNIIALSVFAHSKSNSGIKNLTKADDWVTGIKILNDSYELYNNTYYPGKNKTSFIDLCKNSGIIQTDSDGIVLTSKALSKLSANSFSLRLGDANTTTANVDTIYNQANQIITYDILEGSGLDTKKFLKEFDGSEKSVMQFLYEEYGVKYKIEDGKVKNIATDNESVIIKVANKKTTADFHTIGFVLGENNITFNSSSKSPTGIRDGMLHEICTIKNSDIIMPTIFNINERLGEVKSGISGKVLENRASIDIVFPAETTSDVIECYKKASKTYLKAGNIEYNFYIKNELGNITRIK